MAIERDRFDVRLPRASVQALKMLALQKSFESGRTVHWQKLLADGIELILDKHAFTGVLRSEQGKVL